MLTPNQQLSVNDHRRDIAGMQYVYPVVSRRSGGVSIGINLNPNNACNWRCVYCQVEDLKRGAAPAIELSVLDAELTSMLYEVCQGDFLTQHVPEGLRRLNDIAISGNGEPTTSSQFAAVIALVKQKLEVFQLASSIKVVLITNGSQVHKAPVKAALQEMAAINGEVWFKVDGGSEEEILRVNQIRLSPGKVMKALDSAAHACPTWIQSCFFAWQGAPPSSTSMQDYFALLHQVTMSKIPIKGVLLYGVARPSLQPEGVFIGKLPVEWWSEVERQVKSMGLAVRLSV